MVCSTKLSPPYRALLATLPLIASACSKPVSTQSPHCATTIQSITGGASTELALATTLHGGFLEIVVSESEREMARACTAILQWANLRGTKSPLLWTAQHCLSPQSDVRATFWLFDRATGEHVAYPVTFAELDLTRKLRESLAGLPTEVAHEALAELGAGFKLGNEKAVAGCVAQSARLETQLQRHGLREGRNLGCVAFQDQALLVPSFPSDMSARQKVLWDRTRNEQSQAFAQISLLLGALTGGASQGNLIEILKAQEEMPSTARRITELRFERGALSLAERLSVCSPESTDSLCPHQATLHAVVNQVVSSERTANLAATTAEWENAMAAIDLQASLHFATVAKFFGRMASFVLASTNLTREQASAVSSALSPSTNPWVFVNLHFARIFQSEVLTQADAEKLLSISPTGTAVAMGFPETVKALEQGDSGTLFSVGSFLTLGALTTVNGKPSSGGVPLRAVMTKLPDAPKSSGAPAGASADCNTTNKPK